MHLKNSEEITPSKTEEPVKDAVIPGKEENNTFTHDELNLIDKYRKLTTNDKSEIHDIIQMKIDREENKIINSKIG